MASELHSLRLEREVDEKKLTARTERIQALEAAMQTAQEKLLAQQTMHQAELTKYRALLDSMKGKMSAAAPHARIAKPIKGGAKTESGDGGGGADEEQEEKSGFFSFFRSPSKKNIATSPPSKPSAVLSPRKPEEGTTPAKATQ